jgi:hypothetical protein
MMKPIACVLVVSIRIAQALPAESRPEALVVLRENPAAYVLLGSLAVKMESTRFQELAAVVRRTLSETGGTPLDYERGAICFAYDDVEIRLSANVLAERDEINGFTVQAIRTHAAECASLPAVFRPVRVGGWLEIGASRAIVDRRFGAASDPLQATVRYQFNGNTPGPGSENCSNEGFLFYGYLEVTYVAGRVARIVGDQGTSC